MLDRILKNAMEGLTVIEEETGSIGRILAKQLGGYARTAGKKVVFFSFQQDDSPAGKGPDALMGSQRSVQTIRDIAAAPMVPGSQVYGHAATTTYLTSSNFDLMVIDGFSSHFYERTEREIAEEVAQLTRLVRQGKSFILCSERSLLGEKNAAYIRSAADSVVIVKTDLVGDKIDRMLYVLKLRGTAPLDKLVKVTVDQTGVQVDTREFVG